MFEGFKLRMAQVSNMLMKWKKEHSRFCSLNPPFCNLQRYIFFIEKQKSLWREARFDLDCPRQEGKKVKSGGGFGGTGFKFDETEATWVHLKCFTKLCSEKSTPVFMDLSRYTSEKKKYQKAALGLQDSDEDDHEQVDDYSCFSNGYVLIIDTKNWPNSTEWGWWKKRNWDFTLQMYRRSTPRLKTFSLPRGPWKLWTEHPRESAFI